MVRRGRTCPPSLPRQSLRLHHPRRPRDHSDPDGPAWEITFGLLRAAVESKGTFVTITGGPGSSGLAAADGYTDFMARDHRQLRHRVLDQRGVGRAPVRCDEAAIAYDLYDAILATPRTRSLAEAAQPFVDDCIAERYRHRGSAVLPTTQAVEDLEAIRQYLAVEQIVLYGESYGTQYVRRTPPPIPTTCRC